MAPLAQCHKIGQRVLECRVNIYRHDMMDLARRLNNAVLVAVFTQRIICPVPGGQLVPPPAIRVAVVTLDLDTTRASLASIGCAAGTKFLHVLYIL